MATHSHLPPGMGFVLHDEIYNVHIAANWAYDQQMPMLAPVGVGAILLLPGLLIPPLLVWLLWLVAPREATERHAVD